MGKWSINLVPTMVPSAPSKFIEPRAESPFNVAPHLPSFSSLKKQKNRGPNFRTYMLLMSMRVDRRGEKTHKTRNEKNPSDQVYRLVYVFRHVH